MTEGGNIMNDDIDGEPLTYEDIGALAAARGIRRASLIVLKDDRDPFYAGLPARRRDAEWFADQWHALECGPGTHLRAMHYRIISQRQAVLMPNGEPYENTDECWTLLNNAS